MSCDNDKLVGYRDPVAIEINYGLTSAPVQTLFLLGLIVFVPR